MKLHSPAGRITTKCRYRVCSVAWFITLACMLFTVLPVFTQPAGSYITRGKELLSLYDYKEARKEFTRAIRQNPENADAWYGRGFANGMLGNYKAAVADLTEAIRIRPTFSDAYQNRGQAKECLQDWEGAKADFARVVELDGKKFDELPISTGPGSMREKSLTMRSNVRNIRTQDDMMLVVTEFDLAIDASSHDVSDYLGRGNAWMELREYQKAIDDFSTALSIAPEKAQLWYRRGLARGMTGDFQGAIDDFRKTLELDPFFPDARENLEQALECITSEIRNP